MCMKGRYSLYLPNLSHTHTSPSIMSVSCSFISLSDNALYGVLNYAKNKFENLLKPHHDGWFYIQYNTTPAQLAEMVRATVSDPEPEPVKKVKTTRDQRSEEHNILRDKVDEVMRRDYREVYDAYHRGHDETQQAWRKYNTTSDKIKKAIRLEKAAHLAEIEAEKPARKIAIDQNDVENAMLLHVLETCNWTGFYPKMTPAHVIDYQICKMLDIPLNDVEWAINWGNTVGLILSLGKHKLGGTAEERAALKKDSMYLNVYEDRVAQLEKIIDFLQSNYVNQATYQRH